MYNSDAKKALKKIAPFVDATEIAYHVKVHPNTVINYMKKPVKEELFERIYLLAIQQFEQFRTKINSIEIPPLESPSTN